MHESPRSESLEGLMSALPPDLQEEVKDFAASLLERKRGKAAGPLRQDWAGALRVHGKQYISLGLQKKSLEWRRKKPAQTIS